MERHERPTTAQEILQYATRRIEVDIGEPKPRIGTGYYYCQFFQQKGRTFLVTCEHVITGGTKFFVPSHFERDYWSPQIISCGQTELRFDLNCMAWSNASSDLAAFWLEPLALEWRRDRPGYRPIMRGISTMFREIGSGSHRTQPSEPILMAGCPNGYWDEVNGFPIFRRGYTATHPHINFEGKPQFLVDVGVYGGSSGSPVFIYDDHDRKTPKSHPRFDFLGTLTDGPWIEDGEQHKKTRSRMHLGLVAKASETKALCHEFCEILERNGEFARHDAAVQEFEAMHPKPPWRMAT